MVRNVGLYQHQQKDHALIEFVVTIQLPLLMMIVIHFYEDVLLKELDVLKNQLNVLHIKEHKQIVRNLLEMVNHVQMIQQQQPQLHVKLKIVLN
jgi:hypothetical protein